MNEQQHDYLAALPRERRKLTLAFVLLQLASCVFYGLLFGF